MKLYLEHYPFLVEHLSRYASKWRNLGTALQFQPQDLDNTQACVTLIPRSPYSYMERLVEEWLEEKYPHTTPPTLANLVEALNSHTVGLGMLATLIKDSLPQIVLPPSRKTSSDDLNSTFIIASLTDDTIEQLLSDDVRIDENMPVYLTIQTSYSCQWKRLVMHHDTKKEDSDRKRAFSSLPRSDRRHSGINKHTLSISKVDIDMDGNQYLCEIIHVKHIQRSTRADRKTSNTAPVTLRVNCPQLDVFKDSLASVYLAQPEVPEDSWPPVGNKTYINLALVKQQEINYGEEYAHLTVRGDIDDVLHHKEGIEYSNIFDRVGSGSLFLIEGRPGSGKTTFVNKVTRDWAANEVQGPMRLLLLVSLRVLNSWDRPVTLEDILKLLNLKLSKEVVEDREGKGVCFILDGLDEFSPLEGENSIIHKIINKKYLPQSIVIVASRPVALVKLRQRAQKVIEVVGFPNDQIFEYIEHYPFANSSKVEKLKSYLISHPNVLHMCYLPIHTAMVAFLFKVTGKVPRTETEIYKHFTRFTLMRSLSKHEEQQLEGIDTDKLSGEDKELFKTICEIAFEKTLLNKQVLDQDEMNFRLQSTTNKDISLGLVTIDRTAGLYGFKNIYTFLHLTYQEYLAAHHISTLSDEEQHELVKEHGGVEHMQVVWKFFCGLVKFAGHEYKIKTLFSKKSRSVLSSIQCAYESQQEAVCKCMIKEMNGHITLKDEYLITTDFTALGYLFAYSPDPVKLSLINSNMNIEAVDALLKETEEKPLLLRALHYGSSNVDLESIKKILTQVRDLDYLSIEEKRDHSDNNKPELSVQQSLDDFGFADMVCTSLKSIEEINLKWIRVGQKTLSNILQYCERLKSLTLNRSIEEDNIEPLLIELSLCKELKTSLCSTFTTPEVSINIITETAPALSTQHGSTMLCVHGAKGEYFQTLKVVNNSQKGLHDHWLKSCCLYFPQPKVLGLHQNSQNHHKGISILAENVPDFSALEMLSLRRVIIDDGAITLFERLSDCTTLQELDFVGNHIKIQKGIESLLTGLGNCSNLQKMFLKGTKMKTDGTCVLASCLQYWPKLQELNLWGCSIDEKGANAIADNLKYSPELHKLELKKNNLKSETFDKVMSSLHSCQTFVPTHPPPYEETKFMSQHNNVTKSNSTELLVEPKAQSQVKAFTDGSEPQKKVTCCSIS